MISDTLMGSFIWLLGLAVGSFLNVVLYRLPVGLSVGKPARSFCPRCKAAIRWYDNLPVLSWLLLRARCRNCQVPISVQYPLVEAVTGLAFVTTYHLLFVSQTRVGIDPSVNWPTDAPLLLAWLVLVAALVACSGMDLVSYMVDTRITDFAMYAGIVLYACWPRACFLQSTAAGPSAAAALAAFVVSGVLLLRASRKQLALEGAEKDSASDESEPDSGALTGDNSGPASKPTSAGVGAIAIAVFVGLSIWLLVTMINGSAGHAPPAAEPAVPAALLALFAATVIIGGQRRDVDAELHEAIEEEAPEARRLALRELRWLAGPMLAAAVAYGLVANVAAVNELWRGAILWPSSSSFAPLGGAAYAIHGAMVGAAAGWALRIVFTLVFGREAFGVGDIYILAAAGAAGGWDIVLLGLLFSVGIAMAGWLAGLLLKSTSMIPFGPWLAIGFVAALWLNKPSAIVLSRYGDDIRVAWEMQPKLVFMGIGLMLVGSMFAVVIARLVRHFVEPKP